MQGKGLIRFFTYVLLAVVAYQLILVWPVWSVESDAADYAEELSADIDDPNRISFPNAIIWNTPTGLKPNDKPLVVVNNAKLSLPVVVIYTASVVIVILLTFNEIRRHIKPRPGFQVYSNATIPCLLGIFMLEVIVILYPFDDGVYGYTGFE